ncbi:retinoic acid receptor responder protein 2-like [Nannospalax galili]|uniref:retinoic acid receptor responder protein 2-like n=1 Tax=Nannospalax galili TaxID=1026970 RepID=UPI0004ED0D69|nr:retinoic acid receptor responder protein 2-like [Nannospalax galili]
MKYLLISLALWLGTVGWGGTEPTDLLHRGLEVALEMFHEHPPLEWAFQETAVDSALNMPFPAGNFVKLGFKLQQTNCLKKDWRKPECKVQPNGRKLECVACVKLGPQGNALGRWFHCPIPRGWTQWQELRYQCRMVEQAGEEQLLQR